MLLTMTEREIRSLLHRQLRALFPLSERDAAEIDVAFPESLGRCERCFSRVVNKYYGERGATRFDPLHGCQWAAFLYYLSNSAFRLGGGAVCDKLYALLRMQSGADLYYQVELPDVFTFDHPLGSVIGRGRFSDYFTFAQGCTVGNNHGAYPRFGESVFMMSDSKVIGDCRIGDYVIIGANACVKDEDVPAGSLVFGRSPDLVVKEGRMDYVRSHAEGVFRYE